MGLWDCSIQCAQYCSASEACSTFELGFVVNLGGHGLASASLTFRTLTIAFCLLRIPLPAQGRKLSPIPVFLFLAGLRVACGETFLGRPTPTLALRYAVRARRT